MNKWNNLNDGFRTTIEALPLAPEPPLDLQAAEDETDRLRRENGELRNMLK